MIWYLIKSLVFGLFGLFISFSIVLLAFGLLAILIFRIFKNNHTAFIPILLAIILGAICWSFMGAYFAAVVFSLNVYMKTWLSITIVSVFVLLVKSQTHSQAQKLLDENTKAHTYIDFLRTDGAIEVNSYSHRLASSFFSANIFIIISFVTFLFLNSYSNKLTFGLIDYTLSLIK
jgi:hypothetical protein